jgi:predicted protein tyrosine phosphatase
MTKAESLINWREVESSNVAAVGWDRANNMWVRFKDNSMYCYPGVSRQRAVATARAASVGKYLNRVIKPNFPVLRITP